MLYSTYRYKNSLNSDESVAKQSHENFCVETPQTLYMLGLYSYRICRTFMVFVKPHGRSFLPLRLPIPPLYSDSDPYKTQKGGHIAESGEKSGAPIPFFT